MYSKACFILIIGFFSFIADGIASEKTYVFVLAGQSNMRGRGEVIELLSIAPRLIQVPKNVEFLSEGKPRSLFGERNLRWTFGPEVSFAHEISEAWPDKKITIIKYTVSGSDLSSWEKTYYDILVEQVRTTTKGREVLYAGILWMQGEADADALDKSEHYFEKFKALIHSTRRDLQAPDCPFLFGMLRSLDKPGCENVRKAQVRAANEIPNTFAVPTEGLTTLEDNIHYDTNGQIELGKRFAKKIMALEQNRKGFLKNVPE